MSLSKITLQDYLIVCAGLLPLLGAYAFRDPLASALGTAPKMIVGLGVLLCVAITLRLIWLRRRGTDWRGSGLGLWHRLCSLAMLVAGVTYFFIREEIAEALNWPLRGGDTLMILLAVFAVTWLMDQMPPTPSERDDRDQANPEE